MLSVAITIVASTLSLRSTSKRSVLTFIRPQSRTSRRIRKSSRSRARGRMPIPSITSTEDSRPSIHSSAVFASLLNTPAMPALSSACSGCPECCRIDAQNASRDKTPCQSEKITRPESGSCGIELPGSRQTATSVRAAFARDVSPPPPSLASGRAPRGVPTACRIASRHAPRACRARRRRASLRAVPPVSGRDRHPSPALT